MGKRARLFGTVYRVDMRFVTGDAGKFRSDIDVKQMF